MTPHGGYSCERESEVLDLIAIDQWPARAGESLRSHVTGCPICADLALVASAMASEGHAGEQPVHVPDATIVWYGARLLARTEHARRAARPMLVVHVTALVCAAAAAVVGWRMVAGPAMSWLAALTPDAWPHWSEMAAWATDRVPRWRWLAAGLGAWAVLIPLAFSLVRLVDRGGETEAGRSRL
jgi:hypothetical protein